MKKVILFTFSLCFAVLLNAQISNTEIVPVVGLSSSLTQAVLNTITNP